jgi:hypothetical protein
MKRELDRRTNAHGEEVTLVWYPRTDSVEIEVRDPEAGYTRSAPVPGRNALDAFDHPYLYLDVIGPAALLAA